jgi:uncharacterized glyoxalase superfamily protein PhnB
MPQTIKKVTPILFVPEIEAVLPFWVEQLGFTKMVEVPDGERLAFVILEKDGVEIMYQSYSSVEKDVPAMAGHVRGEKAFLYIEVADLATIQRAVQGAAVYLPERTTFYGAREIGVNDPAGHFITFAQMSPSA